MESNGFPWYVQFPIVDDTNGAMESHAPYIITVTS